MPEKWDGKERRSVGEDHDHITRMLENQTGILEELKDLKVDFRGHVIDDNKKFEKLFWNYGIGVGVVLTVNAAIGFLIMAKKGG